MLKKTLKRQTEVFQEKPQPNDCHVRFQIQTFIFQIKTKHFSFNKNIEVLAFFCFC